MADLIQICNPKTNRWVKIDRESGKIIGHKKSPGPYKNIRIYRQPEVEVVEEKPPVPDHVEKVAFDFRYRCAHPDIGYCKECYHRARGFK